MPYDEIPSTATAAVFAAAGIVATVLILRRQRALSFSRFLVGAALSVYVVGIVVNSVFPIYLGVPGDGRPWTTHINAVPFQGTDTADYVQNVLIFVPLGLILPLAFPIRSIAAVAACGFGLSLTIEALQLINALTGQGGHIADVNDLLANTVGAPIGFVVARALVRLPALRPIAAAFAWPRSGLTTAGNAPSP